MSNAEKLVKLLNEHNFTVSTAESCTGGLISKKITDVSGSSSVFGFGFVTYANEAKQELLDVPRYIINEFGAVSHETALKMSKGAKLKSRSDFSVAVTGIAGPSGGSPQKPVGLVYISCSGKRGSICTKNIFSGSRGEVREQTAEKALSQLIKYIENCLE